LKTDLKIKKELQLLNSFQKLIFYQQIDPPKRCRSGPGTPCVIATPLLSTISSSFFMYLCIRCYCDACLKSSALRAGVKTLHNIMVNIQGCLGNLQLSVKAQKLWSWAMGRKSSNLCGVFVFPGWWVDKPVAKKRFGVNVPEVSMNMIRIGYPAGYLRFFRIRI